MDSARTNRVGIRETSHHPISALPLLEQPNRSHLRQVAHHGLHGHAVAHHQQRLPNLNAVQQRSWQVLPNETVLANESSCFSACYALGCDSDDAGDEPDHSSNRLGVGRSLRQLFALGSVSLLTLDGKRHGQAGAVILERCRPHVHHAQHILVRPALAVFVLGQLHGKLAPTLARVPVSNRAAHTATPTLAVVSSLGHARDVTEQRKQVRWDAGTHRHSTECCGLGRWCRRIDDCRSQSQQSWLLLRRTPMNGHRLDQLQQLSMTRFCGTHFEHCMAAFRGSASAGLVTRFSGSEDQKTQHLASCGNLPHEPPRVILDLRGIQTTHLRYGALRPTTSNKRASGN